jgi:thiamine pyrophosphate-dependent acetolactate synthase large subunit-like protein
LSECSAELIQLIENLNAPCFTTALAKGTIPDGHPLSLSWGGVQYGQGSQFLEEADVVLVVGSSLDEADTERLGLTFPETLIQIDTYSDVIGRKYPVSVGLVGDAKAVLNQLLAELANYDKAARSSPAVRIAEHKQHALGRVQHKLAWQFVDAIQQPLPKDAFVTNDASRTNGWVLSFLQRHFPNTISITRNLAALGYAFPAAVGAKLAYPERKAVAVVGDGGFLFTIFTLATAVQHRINAVAIVFNDQSYGTIRRIQTQRFGRTIGVGLHGPDYVKLAEACGVAGARTENPDHLYDALMTAWQRDVPTVIDVPLDESIDYL